MLINFSVKNYKNFKEKISVDFSNVSNYQFSNDCLIAGHIGKMLIYGKNVCGKTNLGEAFLRIKELIYPSHFETENLLNANSNDTKCYFDYTFLIHSNKINISFALSNNGILLFEKILLNSKKIYEIDFYNKKFDFNHISLINVETKIYETFINQVTNIFTEEKSFSFIGWLFTNYIFDENELLFELKNDILGLYFIDGSGNIASTFQSKKFNQILSIQGELDKFEDFLNAMGFKCKLINYRMPDGSYELYFRYNKLIPFYENLSSGTYGLVRLYYRLITLRKPSFIFYDEFDAFYHYEMSEKIVEFFKFNFTNTQIIFTTNNTNLMNNKLMRPDCIAILSIDGRLTPLCKATNRELREGHNLEKMYISKEFGQYE